jgi:hypothetical protein
MTCDDDESRIGVVLFEPTHQLAAVGVGEFEVNEHDVGVALGHSRFGFGSGVSEGDMIALALKQFAERSCEYHFVVDD